MKEEPVKDLIIKRVFLKYKQKIMISVKEIAMFIYTLIISKCPCI